MPHISSRNMRLARQLSTSLAMVHLTRSIKILLISLTLSSVPTRCTPPTTCLLRALFLVSEDFVYLTDNVPSFSAGITPSNKSTYSLAQITGALKAQSGATPYLGCVQNGTALSEVWYFHHVKGSVSYLKHSYIDVFQ